MKRVLQRFRYTKAEYTPILKLSEFYKGISHLVDDETWKTLRENIYRMECIEEEIFNGKDRFRESSDPRLVERYLKLIDLRDSPLSLLQEKYEDLSPDDQQLYDKYRDQRDKGLFRTKDSWDQRMAKIKKYDAQRNKQNKNDTTPNGQKELTTTDEQNIDKQLDQLEAQATNAPPQEKQKILSKVSGLLGQVKSKFGQSAVGKFIKEHPKFTNAVKTIATHAVTIGLGAWKGQKYLPIFAPLGPIAPLISAVCGVIVAYAVKAAGTAGGKLGADKLAPMISNYLKKKAGTTKGIIQKILTKMTTPQGDAIIKMICGVLVGGAAGALTFNLANAGIKKLGPQLVKAFQSFMKVPDMKQIAEEIAVQGEAAAETAASEISEATPEAPETATQQTSQSTSSPPQGKVVEQPKSQPQGTIKEPSIAAQEPSTPPPEPVSPGIFNAAGTKVDMKQFANAVDTFANQYQDPNQVGNMVIDQILKSNNPQVTLGNMLNSNDEVTKSFAKNFIKNIAPKVMGTKGVSWTPGASLPTDPPLSKLGPVLKAIGTQFT
jgi:hypothetical protein